MTNVGDETTGAISDGHVALVTGSTSGIGREVAHNLAAAGATVLVHGRDDGEADRTLSALPGDGHDCYLADFSEMDEVRDLATRVREDYDRLDVLVNNAGTWQSDRRLVSVPGGDEDVELTFAVNHLAHFLLTALLGDRLCETDEGGLDPARVVTVTSKVHYRSAMDLDALHGPDGPSGVEAYGLSKLANVMFTYEHARRAPDGVVANCCHPGVSPATDLARDGSLVSGLGWRIYGLIGKLVGVTDSPAEAAQPPTYLAGSPDIADETGTYFEDGERSRSAEASYDRSAQQRLWERSVEWADLSEDERDRIEA